MASLSKPPLNARHYSRKKSSSQKVGKRQKCFGSPQPFKKQIRETKLFLFLFFPSVKLSYKVFGREKTNLFLVLKHRPQ